MDCLQLKIGIRVMIIANINIPDGLVNGSIGTVVDYLYHQRSKNVKAILVKLDNPSMGVAARMKYADLSPKVKEGATPIFMITKEFAIKKRRKKHFATYKITQFPLRVAEASTAHKYQGLTVEPNRDIVLHGFKPMPPGMAYVMLSRAKSINSVYLDESFVTTKFSCNPKALEQKLALDLRYVNVYLESNHS